jgi:calcium-translocating P-type ATPase
LAILLWFASALAWLSGALPIAIAIVAVIFINALFAFVQELQAENAVEALAAYIPDKCNVLRDGAVQSIDAALIVPGDVVTVVEGDRISADSRLISGSVEVDMSPLTGESLSVTRNATGTAVDDGLIDAEDVVFSGTACTEGEATAVVFATGMATELGRIAALSEQVTAVASPLEEQVRKVAWLIAGVAVAMGIAFMPIAMIGAGLPFSGAAVFAIGLLVGNVPEGLLPVITLALAASARDLATRGAVIKRLSAAETLGSTTVICTDKTGTLTEGRMTVDAFWSQDSKRLGLALARCSTATVESGDATEEAMLKAVAEMGVDVSPELRAKNRIAQFSFSPSLKLMTTVDSVSGRTVISTKGAPESVLPLCKAGSVDLGSVNSAVEDFASRGLRVLAVAERSLDSQIHTPVGRAEAEANLTFLGLVALVDRPRAHAQAAVAACRAAGIRVFMVTGDHGLTAKSVARQVGISLPGEETPVVTGTEVDSMADAQLKTLVSGTQPVVFARTSPQTKLRIADALRDAGEVVAMTGDGANDAPALRRADIGIAMGLSGTDVAREAATMVLTDDDFSTIVAAVEGGRRVFDNIRKFIFYIFAHTTPEVAPFMIYALSGGAIPLPITIPMVLAFDVGTETLPALALGREAAEPGLMDKPPRRPSEGVIRGGMLVRAWLFLGLISAGLAALAYLTFLTQNGWSLGADTSSGTPLHHVVREGQSLTLAAMVMCQIGTAFAARTDRVSLRSIGVFSNPLLLAGILFELLLTAGIIYLPLLQGLLGTAAIPAQWLLVVLPFPLIVWGADELRRWLLRRP